MLNLCSCSWSSLSSFLFGPSPLTTSGWASISSRFVRDDWLSHKLSPNKSTCFSLHMGISNEVSICTFLNSASSSSTYRMVSISFIDAFYAYC